MNAAMRLGQRRLFLDVEPARGAEARGQQVVRWVPVEPRRTDGRTVSPSVADRQQPGRVSPPARDLQAQLHDHRGFPHRQVLHLVDDAPVDLVESVGQFVVLQSGDGRIPDFPVTRSHPPASWPSAANSSICRTYRKTAGEESRRRSPVANRWMRP